MDFYLGLAQVIGIHTLLGLSAWCVLHTGQVSIAQGAFFAIGAYVAGMLTSMWDWPLALAELLEIVLRDRAFQDDVGRRRMIEVFDLASSQPQVVSEWRRRLGASLNVR